MRQDYQQDFQEKYSVKLGFMSFFVKSCVVALKNFPSVNAEIEGDQIIYKNYYNISIAIGTDRGLVVPVLKKADELSFADIERNIFLLSEKARKGKITINLSGQNQKDLEGNYLIDTDGTNTEVKKVTNKADIYMRPSDLSSIYFGGFSPGEHFQAGNIHVKDYSALKELTKIFNVDQKPWCNTDF